MKWIVSFIIIVPTSFIAILLAVTIMLSFKVATLEEKVAWLEDVALGNYTITKETL